MAEMMNRKQIEEEIRGLDQLMRSNDYIGIKIAMGRATKEEYAEEIAKSEEWAKRKSELQAMLYGTAGEEYTKEEQTEEQPAEYVEDTEEQIEEPAEEPDDVNTEELAEEHDEENGGCE